jgi:hypothetical protein
MIVPAFPGPKPLGTAMSRSLAPRMERGGELRQTAMMPWGYGALARPANASVRTPTSMLGLRGPLWATPDVKLIESRRGKQLRTTKFLGREAQPQDGLRTSSAGTRPLELCSRS